MSENPYSPPQTSIELIVPQIAVPEDVAKKIKNCWVAGVISASVTVLFALIALSGTDFFGLDAWAFVDAVIMAGLTFGVYKKSRVCAILLLSVFLLNKVLMWVELGNPAGLPLTLVFIWFFAQGVIGTFQWHKYRKQAAVAPMA